MAISLFSALDEDLYSIGKATIWFKPLGETAFDLLGDSDDVAIAIEIVEQERFNNECGLRRLARTIVTEINATVSMTLVQLSDLNRGLSLLGDVVTFTQSAVSANNQVEVGEGTLGIKRLDFPFIDAGTFVMTDGVAVPYVEDVNFKLDAQSGYVQIIAIPGGADSDLDMTYDVLAVVPADGKNKIGIGSKPENRGTLIIRGCAAVGPNLRVTLHDVQLRPSGDRSYVSETDFDTIELEGSIFLDTSQPSGFELGEELLLEIPTGA